MILNDNDGEVEAQLQATEESQIHSPISPSPVDIHNRKVNRKEAEMQEAALASSVGNTEMALVVGSNNFDDEKEVEREFGIEGLDVMTPYLELSLLQRRTLQFVASVLDVQETPKAIDLPNSSPVRDPAKNDLLNSPTFNGDVNGNVYYNQVGTSEARSTSTKSGAPSPKRSSTSNPIRRCFTCSSCRTK
jgi:hypothetical protein